MPIGIQRLNAKKSQPNSLIIFIKPLKGPDEAVAQEFLERIAAQCLPIMREHHMSVMSLEEYEPNKEFVGRNFNAGEVIQLVLKSPSTGRWLPFNYVQMVMMHELAHCKQMNHSRAFWAVRNRYAEQMHQLWSNGYTGEGLWGRGALLTTGGFEINTVLAGEILPEHLCGGTYRSRRKRKAKAQLTYRQQKERRILKKFGANGVALGDDEAVKVELEKGKRTVSKPRVAQSKRGRELRAAAALARFGEQKKTDEELKEEVKVKDEDETASEAESETASESENEALAATDVNGKRLLDGKGHRMIKVCGDENPDDGDAQNELRELQSSMKSSRPADPPTISKTLTVKREGETRICMQDLLPHQDKTTSAVPKRRPASNLTAICIKYKDNDEAATRIIAENQTEDHNDEKQIPSRSMNQDGDKSRSTSEDVDENSATSIRRTLPAAGVGVCPLCSTENGPVTLTCAVCSHVLDGRKDSRAWKCSNPACQGSLYLNAGDVALCGVCGGRKSGS